MKSLRDLLIDLPAANKRERKRLFMLILALIALLAMFASPPEASAQDQYSATTLYSFAGTDTNVVAGTTNLGASANGGVVSLTKWDNFVLEFRATGTNAALTTTLGYTVAWQTSADGTNWGTVDNINRGWFSIPTTNVNPIAWTTNITVNTIGFWRINWLTNSSGQCITNMAVRAWRKPLRSGSLE